MEQLKAALQQADDDYLTGLSNKGILKRAYKDLDGETPTLIWQGEDAQVTLKSETCLIKNPLGESSCSCPSSGICRHVVTAILWLKGQMGQNDQEVQGSQGLQEFLSVPMDRLKRACGSRRFQTLLGHIRTGEQPELKETSIVTVTIPWEQTTVRLLSPLEYSTCTCHSKELCGHKAQALLFYQLKYGKIRLKDLETLETQESTIDMELAKDAAGKVREHILAQFEMGLSRQSLEAEESLERLAIICHRAQLAGFESKLREAASDYRQHFGRSAAFRTEELFRKLLALHELAGQVLAAKAPAQLSPLAGSFRSDYERVGRLRLTGMGARSFSSKTGYEGEIYYFLETQQKKWYTWTDARPLFYENVHRRPGSAAGQAAAPWGLTCSREQMSEMEFELTNAKAAAGERLSSSQDTRGEIIGPRNLNVPQIQELIYEDYEQLLKDYFGTRQSQSSYMDADLDDTIGYNDSDGGEDDDDKNGSDGNSSGERGRRRERLVLVRATHWEEPVFDSISQQFSWGLHDRKGCTLFISLRYTKKERLTITLLERLEQRLKRQEEKNLLFLGAVYLENGRLCLYPIEFFRQRQEVSGEGRTSSNLSQQDVVPEISVNSTANLEYTKEYGQSTAPETATIPSVTPESAGQQKQRSAPEAAAKSSVTPEPAGQQKQRFVPETVAIPATVLEAMEQYRQEAARTLSDLLVSGLSSVQEEILSALSVLAEDGRRLGLSFAGEWFSAIREMLGNRRHQMDFQPIPVMDAMARLSRYLTACGQKLSYDRARLAMEPDQDMEFDEDMEPTEGI